METAAWSCWSSDQKVVSSYQGDYQVEVEGFCLAHRTPGSTARNCQVKRAKAAVVPEQNPGSGKRFWQTIWLVGWEGKALPRLLSARTIKCLLWHETLSEGGRNDLRNS